MVGFVPTAVVILLFWSAATALFLNTASAYDCFLGVDEKTFKSLAVDIKLSFADNVSLFGGRDDVKANLVTSTKA